jgi:iron(III) transport system permease protein
LQVLSESVAARRRRRLSGAARHPLLSASAVLAAAIVLMPAIAILVIAATGGTDNWPHLLSNVIPRATLRTLILLAGVGAITTVVGVVTAWLVASCDFPGRRVLSGLLVLPLAIPAYLGAYAFAEFFSFTGPVQTGWRALFGFQTSRDYWFPEVRTTGGAMLVLSSVLYPYIYLAAR